MSVCVIAVRKLCQGVWFGVEGLHRVSGFLIRVSDTWKREFKLPWREAGPPNHHDDKVDSDQQVVNKELYLWTDLEKDSRRARI